MSTVDDLLDDAHWANVQDPIKQMFLSLSKAMRVQASAIRDLDRRCNERVTIDQASRLIQEDMCRMVSKQDAKELVFQIEAKASARDLRHLQEELDAANKRIASLSEESSRQQQSINILLRQVEVQGQELSLLKTPSYDILYAYVDRVSSQLQQDMESKLAVKADRVHVETALPLRLEDLYRKIYGSFQDLSASVQRMVRKEDVIDMLDSKADARALQELQQTVFTERPSRHEVSSQLTSHLKPLLLSLQSAEQTATRERELQLGRMKDMQEELDSVSRLMQQLKDMRIFSFLKHHQEVLNSSGKESVEQLVTSVLQDKGVLKLLDPLTFQMDFQTQLQAGHERYQVLLEASRTSDHALYDQALAQHKAQVQGVIEGLGGEIKETSEKLARTRVSLRELSLN
ncbi:hypothetical protein EON64_17425, partial [archaeon]